MSENREGLVHAEAALNAELPDLCASQRMKEGAAACGLSEVPCKGPYVRPFAALNPYFCLNQLISADVRHVDAVVAAVAGRVCSSRGAFALY